MIDSVIVLVCYCCAGIGMATVLVNAGLTTFDKILAMNARDLELVSSQFLPS